jgi:pentatricopeptide repeat protein
VDLIAKVNGLQKAESFLEQIPQSFKTEAVYESLIANCVILNDVKKAEEIFKKIKDLSLPRTIYVYNQFLILCRRMAPTKILNLFKTMERDKVKPSLFSYNLLIDLKGRSKDIEGMEQVLKSMKAEGMGPDIAALGIVTQYYIAAGLGQKAEATLKDLEGDISKNRGV